MLVEHQKSQTLTTQSLKGDKIVVSGKLCDGLGTKTPIPNAIIEVWNADSGGIY